MDTIKTIEKRRSIRNFDASFQIPELELRELIRLASLSPTSFNIQHWKFVVVTDMELRAKIKKAAMDQQQVTDASVLIIICSDVHAWRKNMNAKWKNVPEKIGTFMVNSTMQFYNGREQLQRDEAIRSASLATQTLLLAATALGYESGPMVGFDFEQVAKLINLPKDYIISNFVVIGKGIQDAMPRGGQLQLEEIFIKNKF